MKTPISYKLTRSTFQSEAGYHLVLGLVAINSPLSLQLLQLLYNAFGKPAAEGEDCPEEVVINFGDSYVSASLSTHSPRTVIRGETNIEGNRTWH